MDKARRVRQRPQRLCGCRVRVEQPGRCAAAVLVGEPGARADQAEGPDPPAVAHEQVEHAGARGQRGHGVQRIVGLQIVGDADDGAEGRPVGLDPQAVDAQVIADERVTDHPLGERGRRVEVGAGRVGLDLVPEQPDVEQLADLLEVAVLLEHLHCEGEVRAVARPGRALVRVVE